MDKQLRLCEELLALRTLQIAFVFVNFHVFVEITLLREGLATTIHRAGKWFFLSMRSQMIKEIVPFLEGTVAIPVLAEKGLCPTFAVVFEKLDIFKCFNTWQL